MLVYKARNSVLQELHPITILTYLVVVVTGALLLSHPTLLVVIFLAVLATLFVAGGGPAWTSSVKYFFVMIMMLLVINVLANNLGRTIIWTGFTLPVLGRVSVSLEVLAYSLVMALRLLIVYSAFVLYNYALDPDRALSLFAGFFPRSTLLVALATKTIPYLSQQLQRVAEIQQTRGIRYHSGSLYQRAKNRIPLLKVVFMSSLEDSFNVGESIQARAYGSGPRTRYAKLSIKGPDILILSACMTGAVIMVWAYINSFGSMHFFPEITGSLVSLNLIWTGSIINISLLMPAAVTWGCKRWNYSM